MLDRPADRYVSLRQVPVSGVLELSERPEPGDLVDGDLTRDDMFGALTWAYWRQRLVA